MRRILYTDLSALARALMAAEVERREGLASHIITCAAYADKFTRRLRRPHPRWGDGTLGAAARSFGLAPVRGFDDLEYCTCFGLALAALGRRRRAAQVHSRH